MKKNILIKSILVIVVIALLAIGFCGCGTIIPPTTGTVYLIISVWSWSTYDLYMDFIPQYWSVWSGTYVLYNVPAGSHFFEAYDTWGWGYDAVTQYITPGVINYVYLYP